MQLGWVTSIQQQCQQAGVPFFFKQWAGFQPKSKGRLLNGQTYEEYPPVTQAAIPGRQERIEMRKEVDERAKTWRMELPVVA